METKSIKVKGSSLGNLVFSGKLLNSDRHTMYDTQVDPKDNYVLNGELIDHLWVSESSIHINLKKSVDGVKSMIFDIKTQTSQYQPRSP